MLLLWVGLAARCLRPPAPLPARRLLACRLPPPPLRHPTPASTHPCPRPWAAASQVGRGSFVLDPFVGTGSVLVPAAHRGALTLGTDIDIRVIRLGASTLLVF